MLSTWVWISFNLLIYASASLEDGNTKAFIELTELGYEDTCYDTAEAEWSFINSPSNETLSLWKKKLIAYANFKKEQKNEIANISKDVLSNPFLQHKYDVIEKAGNALLNEEDLETFVHFIGEADSVIASKLETEKVKNYTHKDVEHVLSHNNDIEQKSDIWRAWQEKLNPLVGNFSHNLLLIEKAAQANGASDVTEYWELLSGFPNGYSTVKQEWSKIATLHKKIAKFVMANLSHKYGITMDTTIPAHLLGTLQGNDWTAMSVDVSPHPNIVYNIKKNLWKRKLIGKSLYKIASTMGTTVLNQVPHANFWNESQFNQQCPSTVVNFCKYGIMRVSTCFEPTISNFLAAHKNVGKVLFNQMSVEDTPVLNTANRYSGLEEGISELFSILSASPAWLNHTHLMDNSTENEQRSLTSLMITALNVLPRLAYYLSVDLWRINAIENKITKPADLVSSWWEYRKEYEGISSNGSDTPTFLNDDYVIQNKPYLPKFAGTVLAFQIYEYLMDSTEVRYDRIMGKQINANLVKMIQQGSANAWMGVLEEFLELDEISSDSLISFFSSLEDFIDDIDEDYEYKSGTVNESELTELQKKVIQEMNAPTTTTTTAPTTTFKKKKMTSTTPSSKRKDESKGTDTAANSMKDLESKSSIHVQEEKPEDHKVSKSEVSTKAPFDESYIDSLDNEENNKPKINTSKAVWAVGAVLLATIIICIIAIFGRQRCRKTPKNRRYV